MSSLLFLPFTKSESALALGLVLGTVTVVRCIWTMLEGVKEDSRMEPPPTKTQYITQETEDSLPLDTLEKLVQHPNHSIVGIATKILAERIVFDEDAMNILIKGIGSKNYEHRFRCLRALNLLVSRPSYITFHHLSNRRTYRYIIKCLQNCIAEYDPANPPLSHDRYWDEYPFRAEDERMALDFLHHIASNVKVLIEAGIVDHWLVKQAWGTTPEERQKNFASYVKYKKNRIVELILLIQHQKWGPTVLRRAGLLAEPEPSVRVYVPTGNRSWNGQHQGARLGREQSEEEVRLRRQNRETMVVINGPEAVFPGLEDGTGHVAGFSEETTAETSEDFPVMGPVVRGPNTNEPTS